MPEIKLLGCTPQPLSHYLKALGVLRLIVEQNLDAKAKGFWLDDTFILQTHRSVDDLRHFFLHDYQPTPLISPWNSGTGFYLNDNPKTLSAIKNSQTLRLLNYRETIDIATKQIDDLKLISKPSSEENKQKKKKLLTRLRNHLPDSAVRWLDSCVLITPQGLKFPPLLGTGGNDGRFEFSRTFMQQLALLIDFQTGEPTENALLMLVAALNGTTVPGLRFAGKIGQFNPMAAGGMNAAPSYEAPSRVNPWDYVLMLEGTILFASGATRRYENSTSADFAYPFTVRPSVVGEGNTKDGHAIRGELWVPLWTRPTALEELQIFFNEGRATVAGRTARSGVDFAMAIASRGLHRSIEVFIRYSFQARNGESYFAIPCGRIASKFNPKVDLLVELDTWLIHIKQSVANTMAPASMVKAYRRLETVLFFFSTGKKQLLDVLIALAEMEAACDLSLSFTRSQSLRPVPLLNSNWVQACNDSSTEFRLALVLAGRALRQRLVRVEFQKHYPTWAKDDALITWQQGSLVNNLINLLRREEVEAQQHRQQEKRSNFDITSSIKNDLMLPKAQLDDITLFIDNKLDDARIEAIARGLSLVNLPKQRPKSTDPTLPISAAYALVAIAMHRALQSSARNQIFGQNILPQDLTLSRVPALLSSLAAGDCLTATTLCAKRLSANGFKPAISEGIYEPAFRTKRIAAALTFSLSDLDVARLLKFCRQIELH